MSANKILSIMDLFSESKRVWKVEEMSQALSIPVSSLYRYIKILKESNYLRESNEGYLLGYKFLHLGSIVREDINLVEIAKPVLDRLTEKIGETSILNILSNDSAICVATSAPRNLLIRVTSQEGSIMPLYAGASFRSILAFQSEPFIHKYLEGIEIHRYTENTIKDKETLLSLLSETRRLGYAKSENELDEGVLAYGMPLKNYRGKVVASLSVAGPTFRLERIEEEKILTELQGAVQSIEEYL